MKYHFAITWNEAAIIKIVIKKQLYKVTATINKVAITQDKNHNYLFTSLWGNAWLIIRFPITVCNTARSEDRAKKHGGFCAKNGAALYCNWFGHADASESCSVRKDKHLWRASKGIFAL